jgi:hypothetical protein
VNIFISALLFFALPYWETKPVKDWTMEELVRVFQASPWAQESVRRPLAGGPPVYMYLGSARPMVEAEEELRRRKKLESDPVAQEYAVWRTENAGKYIVISMVYRDSVSLAKAEETERMEKESELYVGRKKVPLAMYFPPSSSDPHLRLAFVRPEGEEAKKLLFDLYVPGPQGGYRQVEFKTSELEYHGHVEY